MSSSTRLRIPLFLAAVTLLAFANAPFGEYCYDDLYVIRDSKTIEHGAGMAKLVSRDYGPAFGDLQYRPLTVLTWFADGIVFRKTPFFSHLLNMALHLAAGLALFGLWRRVFRREALAAFAAALFLCHPITTESVNVCAFRRESLCVLLTAWTVHLLWRCARERRVRLGVAAAAVWFAGLLAKEPTFMAPFLAAILLWFAPDRPRESGESRASRSARFWLPVAAVFAVALALWVALYLGLRPHMTVDYTQFTSTKPITTVTPASLDPVLRFLNSCRVFLIYAKLWIIPIGLSVFPYFEPSVSFGDWRVWAGAGALAGFFLFSLWAWRRGSPAGVGGLWACVCLAPIAQIIPAPEWVAERYVYPAHAGIALLIASLVLGRFESMAGLFPSGNGDAPLRPAKRDVGSRSRYLLLFLLLGTCVVLSFLRNQDWRDDLTLNIRAYQLWHNTEGRVRLGALLLMAAQDSKAAPAEKARSLDEARRNLERAVGEDPSRSDAWRMLGLAAWKMGDRDAARAHFQKAFDLNPTDPLNRKAMEMVRGK